jgi:hypothetical protein
VGPGSAGAGVTFASIEATGEEPASTSPPSLGDAIAIPDPEKNAASSIPSSPAIKAARVRKTWSTAVPPPEGIPLRGAFKEAKGR